MFFVINHIFEIRTYCQTNHVWQKRMCITSFCTKQSEMIGTKIQKKRMNELFNVACRQRLQVQLFLLKVYAVKTCRHIFLKKTCCKPPQWHLQHAESL